MHCRRATEPAMADTETRLPINCFSSQTTCIEHSSDVDVEERDQDDAGGNDSHGDEGQGEAIGRRR
jgi:hypothetical protein